MVEPIQNSGVINHPKRKSESDLQNAGKKSRQFFCPLRFCKIVTNITYVFAYIS